jgi:hypothetical protein
LQIAASAVSLTGLAAMTYREFQKN